jgi:hypothetical protein
VCYTRAVLCRSRHPVAVVQDTREKVHTSVKDKLDLTITSRSKADEKFQGFVASEIAEIRNAIRIEAEVRFPAGLLPTLCVGVSRYALCWASLCVCWCFALRCVLVLHVVLVLHCVCWCFALLCAVLLWGATTTRLCGCGGCGLDESLHAEAASQLAYHQQHRYGLVCWPVNTTPFF